MKGDLRYFAVSDDGRETRVLSARPPAQLPTAFPGYTVLGSPLLDENDNLVGLVERISSDGMVVSGNADAVRVTLANLGWPVAQPQSTSPTRSVGTSSGAGNDTVAETDQLGFDVYVNAFADLIMSEYTKPPLTIGIFGSWGMGKSFLLEHIRRTIRTRQAAGNRTGPRIHTVCFNAWEYSATDAIWPALVRKIVTELDQLSSWPRRKRVWTRLRWNLRREWRSLRIKLVTAALALAIVAAVAVGKQGLAVGLGGLTALLGIAGLVKAANDPVAKWVTGLFAGSDYGGQISLMEDIKHDLEELERRLHVDGDPNKHGLTGRILVIIDDLDRCEPAKAVEVLQAVNLLLNFPSFIVCLGIDARIITAAVEKHYEGLLGAAGASGYEYLDKIVQIPFRIPEPNPNDITTFIKSQLAVRLDPGAVARPAKVSDSQPQEDSSPTAMIQFDRVSEQAQPERVEDPDELAERKLRRSAMPEVLFTMDEQRAFELFVPYLRPNPRHLKRLINVYRLVRSLGLAEQEPLMVEQPAAVLRWLIMWAQWPLTSSIMLRRLEDAAFSSEAGDPLLDLLDKAEKAIDSSETDRKARADRDDDPAKLRGLLNVADCALSLDGIRRIRRYTVNFNPAVEEQLRALPASAVPAQPSA
ncbi:MAG TPA: P-loop NTPase fold protein [Jatrophihabitans sp.]|nr:P-loop NTPase fold protein [Jatrophihabitans sp.]